MNIKCLALNWTKVSLYSSKTFKGARDDQCGSGLCYLFSRAGLHSMLRPERQGSSSGIVPNRIFLFNPVVPLSVPLNNFHWYHYLYSCSHHGSLILASHAQLTSLILNIQVMVNWHLSKRVIRWSVSRDHITSWSLEFIEVSYFSEVDRWPGTCFRLDPKAFFARFLRLDALHGHTTSTKALHSRRLYYFGLFGLIIRVAFTNKA